MGLSNASHMPSGSSRLESRLVRAPGHRLRDIAASTWRCAAAACSSLPTELASEDGPPPLNYADQHDGNRRQEQHMDESAKRMHAEESDRPKHHQDHRYR